MSRYRGGKPRIGSELRELNRQMSLENPLWGAPRIHGELLTLGFLKHLLRKANARTIEAVCAAIGELLGTFTPDECTNYFKNAGY